MVYSIVTKEEITARIAKVNVQSADFKKELKAFKEGMYLLKHKLLNLENNLEESEAEFLRLTSPASKTIMKVMNFRRLDRTG
ncbi:hypothetical protein [Desertivirga brevis]|uniref:hypothetical protein n=1 Tax=Desertivirga brevis TaxID=2810310 RepID=UPI001A96A5A8|nr:hypothetical protein [Pedobacter sp. SYSU D00873]